MYFTDKNCVYFVPGDYVRCYCSHFPYSLSSFTPWLRAKSHTRVQRPVTDMRIVVLQPII